MSKRRKHNRTRAKRQRHATRVKLHKLASVLRPIDFEPSHVREAKVRHDLPVHRGGEISCIDPRFPEGSRLRHEAISDALRLQRCRAAVGVGDHTTITLLEPNGWSVRNWHGDVDNKREFEGSNISLVDERAQSKGRNRARRKETDHASLAAKLKNKALREYRERYQWAIWEAQMETYL